MRGNATAQKLSPFFFTRERVIRVFEVFCFILPSFKLCLRVSVKLQNQEQVLGGVFMKMNL